MIRHLTRILARLATDRRGIAMVEFALVLVPSILMLAVIVDLGFAYTARLAMLRGVAAGAIYAFEHGGEITTGTADALRSKVAGIVTDTAGSMAPKVVVLVNDVAGPDNAGNYYCTAGYPSMWTSTGATSGPCADKTRSAKFVTIRAIGEAPALVTPVGLGVRLFPLHEAITVRMR